MTRAIEKEREQDGGPAGSRSFSAAKVLTGGTPPVYPPARIEKSHLELDSIVKEVATASVPDYDRILRLTAREQAYVMGTDDYKCLIMAKFNSCLLDRKDRMTKAQKTAFDLFFKSGLSKRETPKVAEGKVEVGTDDD